MSTNNNDKGETQARLYEILDRFGHVVVLVIGDVMLDRYWWGRVTRISPEAPVPVVRYERSTLAAGGAANVAANIVSLGGRPLLVGLVGNDEGSRDLRHILSETKIMPDYLISIPGRPTTVKTRIIAHGQQIVRVDEEEVSPISDQYVQQVRSQMIRLLPSAHALIISDYAKGLLTSTLLRIIIDEARHQKIPIFVDPKGKDYTRYNGATIITPNRHEAAKAVDLEPDGQSIVEQAGAILLSRFAVDAVLITQGEEGMTLFSRDIEPLRLPALARQVYDVTGAGDTVIATLSLALSAGTDLPTAATLANLAAGLAVEQVGTTAVSLASLRQALDGRYVGT